MRIKTYWHDNGKYFCASTIINKYGLLHTINIIYMGLFIIIIMRWTNMTNTRINYARINDVGKIPIYLPTRVWDFFWVPQAGSPNLLIFWITFLRRWCLQWCFFMNFLHCRVSLWSGLECEVFFFSVYVELDFFLPDINVGIGSAQKWPSKDDGYFWVRTHWKPKFGFGN